MPNENQITNCVAWKTNLLSPRLRPPGKRDGCWSTLPLELYTQNCRNRLKTTTKRRKKRKSIMRCTKNPLLLTLISIKVVLFDIVCFARLFRLPALSIGSVGHGIWYPGNTAPTTTFTEQSAAHPARQLCISAGGGMQGINFPDYNTWSLLRKPWGIPLFATPLESIVCFQMPRGKAQEQEAEAGGVM